MSRRLFTSAFIVLMSALGLSALATPAGATTPPPPATATTTSNVPAVGSPEWIFNTFCGQHNTKQAGAFYAPWMNNGGGGYASISTTPDLRVTLNASPADSTITTTVTKAPGTRVKMTLEQTFDDKGVMIGSRNFSPSATSVTSFLQPGYTKQVYVCGVM